MKLACVKLTKIFYFYVTQRERTEGGGGLKEGDQQGSYTLLCA